MQIEVKAYTRASDTVVLIDTDAKTVILSDRRGSRGQALSLLAYMIAAITPEMTDVLPRAVVRSPVERLSAIVAEPSKEPGQFQEIARLDPRWEPEFRPDRLGTIIDALGRAVGALTAYSGEFMFTTVAEEAAKKRAAADAAAAAPADEASSKPAEKSTKAKAAA